MQKSHKTHEHDKDMLRLNQQQVSWVVALLLLSAFFVFIAGYYWGQKNALDPLADYRLQSSLADRVQYAMCALNADTVTQVEQAAESGEEMPVVIGQETAEEAEAAENNYVYYAPLVGFGSIKAAQAYVDKLGSYGFEVKIIEHEGKTSKGKTRVWYQVITPLVSDERALQQLIEDMQKVAPLRSVKIVSLDKEQQERLQEKIATGEKKK